MISQESQTRAKQVRMRILDCIQQIPFGMVSTYGAVARAAGIAGGARQVAATLRHSSKGVPWHRVVGAGGEIKIPGHGALEQRMLLKNEAVKFRGHRIEMSRHEFEFPQSRAFRR